MIHALLLCLMLFQASAPAELKPVVDNDRVIVWDVTSANAQPLDAVIVSTTGDAAFVPKGTAPKLSGRSFMIDLKDHPGPKYTNTSTYPLAFPRPGSKKILENDRVIVWDYTWTPNEPTPMHFHDKDVVVVFLNDGDLTSTTPDGKSVLNQYKFGNVRFISADAHIRKRWFEANSVQLSRN